MATYTAHNFEDGQVLTHTHLNEMDAEIVNLAKHLDSRTIVAARPKSQGVANAIKRAYQFTDVLWTPKGEIPGVDYGPVEGRVKYWFHEGVTYRGVPYEGGVISTYTYSGLNNDLDTFLGAVENPNSILYNYDSNNDKGGAYYGTVCSKLVQHALAMPATHNTASIPRLECVDTIALADKYTVDDVQLGDILCYTESHTAMVTGIYYNGFHSRKSGGELLYIEVSDAVYPVCRRRLYNPTQFYNTWIKNYGLYRYKYIDLVPYVENDFVKVDQDREPIKYFDYALMPYYGNKVNYTQGSGTETVHILKKGYSKAIVKRDGVIVDTINITDSTTSFKFSKAQTGHIEMYLEDAQGNKSGSVYCYVVKATISVTDSSKYSSGELKVSYSGTSGKPYYVQFGTDQTQNLRLDGLGKSIPTSTTSATLKFDVKRASKNLRVAYQNEYGTYYSSTITFEETNPNLATNTSSNNYLSLGDYYKNFGLTKDDTSPTAMSGKHTYIDIPVEMSTEYSIPGATFVWFLGSGKSMLSYIEPTSDTITTPVGTMYMSIVFNGAEDSGTDSVTRLKAVNAISDIKIADTTATFIDNTNLSSSSYSDSANDDYFVYKEIPVKANTIYYSRGGARTWYLDSSKKSLSTVNILSGTEMPFVFTTPAKAAYISIGYPKKSYKARKDMVYIREMSSIPTNVAMIDCES